MPRRLSGSRLLPPLISSPPSETRHVRSGSRPKTNDNRRRGNHHKYRRHGLVTVPGPENIDAWPHSASQGSSRDLYSPAVATFSPILNPALASVSCPQISTAMDEMPSSVRTSTAHHPAQGPVPFSPDLSLSLLSIPRLHPICLTAFSSRRRQTRVQRSPPPGVLLALPPVHIPRSNCFFPHSQDARLSGNALCRASVIPEPWCFS